MGWVKVVIIRRGEVEIKYDMIQVGSLRWT